MIRLSPCMMNIILSNKKCAHQDRRAQNMNRSLSLDLHRRIWHLLRRTHRLPGFTGPVPPPLLIRLFGFQADIFYHDFSYCQYYASQITNFVQKQKPGRIFVPASAIISNRVSPPGGALCGGCHPGSSRPEPPRGRRGWRKFRPRPWRRRPEANRFSPR